MNKSAGAIIKDKDGKILMIDRVLPPLGWACPAGHIDEGEIPEKAMEREAKEEVNLDIKNYKLLIQEFAPDNVCVKGVRGHDWYVFEVIGWEGKVKVDPMEAKNFGWFSPKEIKELKLEKIWAKWFKKLKII